MPKEINCEKVKENIDKLKTLKSEFLVEMERIKKDGIAGSIYELKKEIEDVKGFLDEELKEYLLTEEEKEEILNKELEKYLVKGGDNLIDLIDAPQKLKDRIVNWEGSIKDYLDNVSYPNLQTVKGNLYAKSAITFSADSLQTVEGGLNVGSVTIFSANSLQTVKGYLYATNAATFLADSLQTVKGYLYAGSATIFSADSLQTVKRDLYAQSATTFLADSLQTVEKIFLKKSNFKKFFDDNDNFDWEQAKKEGKIILPKETRKKVIWE